MTFIFWICLLISDLHATLPLRVFFIHNSLLLSPLLLFPTGLGSLLTLRVSLLQEVFLHAGSVSVSLLFTLNIQGRQRGLIAAL